MNTENLLKCSLFQGIERNAFNGLLKCLHAKEKCFHKGENIFTEGDIANTLGIVLTGTVQIERVDYYGNRSILTTMEEAQIFGESFAYAGVKHLPINAVATKDSVILLLEASRITTPCANTCDSHNILIQNLLHIVASKNLAFHEKLEITSKRTTREKLMTYLLLQAKKSKSNSFNIPYDRQGLADYLEVDRSGLSAEISKLRKEGILENRKNSFQLKSDAILRH